MIKFVFPLETKKTTFLLKIWLENVKFFQGPRSTPPLSTLIIVYTGP